MSPHPILSRRRALAAGLGLLALGACGTPAADPAAPTGSGFPRTVGHLEGDTTIPAQPQRVVAMTDYLDLDLLLALGVRPVLFGFTDSWGSGILPWQRLAGVEQLSRMDVPSLEVRPEQVAAVRPDLLVGMPPAADAYAQLSAVAPTICLDWDTTWRDGLPTVARAVGREDRVPGLTAGADAAVADAARRLDRLGGATVMVGSAYSDRLYVQGETSPMVALLRSLGLVVHTLGGEPITEHSLEEVSVLSPAAVLLSPATDAAGTAAAEASELWRRLPAVRAGRYSVLAPVLSRGMAENLSPLNIGWVLDQVLPLLERTAAGDGVPLGRGGS